jgi:hypothetical protein
MLAIVEHNQHVAAAQERNEAWERVFRQDADPECGCKSCRYQFAVGEGREIDGAYAVWQPRAHVVGNGQGDRGLADTSRARDGDETLLGNDGITLCREPPAAVNEGEIAVASSEELHAARLSGRRLLALWNALPGVEKRRKVGDRDALIEQLWSAIESLPEPQSEAKRPSKQDEVIAMLRRPEGATVHEVVSATGWQRHTVRGVFSGTLKKKLGLTLASAKEERGRVYRIAEPARA